MNKTQTIIQTKDINVEINKNNLVQSFASLRINQNKSLAESTMSAISLLVGLSQEVA